MTTQSESQQQQQQQRPIPVLLLKTKNSPTDPYEVYLSSSTESTNGSVEPQSYEPIFLPVLQHSFANLDVLKGYILSHRISSSSTTATEEEKEYTALIITSQRAVEALADVISALSTENPEECTKFLKETVIYVVGPATRNALVALGFEPDNIRGEESGSGSVLGSIIAEDFDSDSADLFKSAKNGAGGKRGLLFLVGEQHSTGVTDKLTLERELKGKEMIPVEELEVYKTVVRDGFENEFRGCLDALDQISASSVVETNDTNKKELRWIVLFSPTGTRAALKVMEERRKVEGDGVVYKICAIGPTTRDYLWQGFKRRADAVAKTPSPEGVGEAILGRR